MSESAHKEQKSTPEFFQLQKETMGYGRDL